ncbi:MAG: lipid IV(A) 3-deoxy-D-manno-octulosonic acid transferase [Rugosibacter sp.]|nr:lipid IV(A) 3-deoxy-D-manno-octulosonic acid transferase [Rugosibacter sp.]
MARFLYTLLTCAMLPWALLHLLWRARRQPEYLRHWRERFGFFPAVALLPARRVLAGTLWLHAVSVGETRAAEPLVAALRQRYPDHRILLTHMTPTGRATSEALFGDRVERIYLPYDLPWAVHSFLRRYQPELGLILETELWPNLLAACREASVPVLLVNARLSARSAARYARFTALTREALHNLSAIGAQTLADAARLGALGATAVTVTGNMKFDIEPPPAQLELAQTFRARCGPRPTWLAASTREGEEALILEAWKKLGSDEATALQGGRAKNALLAVADGETAKSVADPRPLLIIVPRHPQRFDAVARLAQERGFRVQRRSENQDIAATTEVLIGDSMGEMFAWYGAADLAFIGGSLKDFGSQNLIEAAAVGTPVLIGPSTFNFADAVREALACGAARPVQDADDLVGQVLALLADPAARARMSAAGREFSAHHRGATARTLALIDLEKAASGKTAMARS